MLGHEQLDDPIPFGRLLSSPFCTRQEPYPIVLLKGLIALCQQGRSSDPKILACLKRLQSQKRRQNAGMLDWTLFIRHVTIFERLCKDEIFFAESFLVITSLLQTEDWKETWGRCLDRILKADLSLDVLSSVDNIIGGPLFFASMCDYTSSRTDRLTSALLDGLTKVISGRFDDDFDGAWKLVERIDANLKNAETNTLISFAKLQLTLGRLTQNDPTSLDLSMNLVERIFMTHRLQFKDPDAITLMVLLADLLHQQLQQSDDASKVWIYASLASAIRRISRTVSDISEPRCEEPFVNLTRFVHRLFSKRPGAETASLHQATIAFISSFAPIKGLAKSSQLCCAYIWAGFNLPTCCTCGEALLTDLLEHCEGGVQMGGLDDAYERNLMFFLDQLSAQLRSGNYENGTMALLYQVCSAGLSGRRHFLASTRYQIISFLLCTLREHQASLPLAQLLESRLYPLLNSLLHSRFQESPTSTAKDSIGSSFEFQCFVQEYGGMIFDLVALGSWIQVKAGLRSFQHFVAVYSPTATWIAYGRKPGHRQVCLELYWRWDALANGAFMSQHRDSFVLAMLHVLLDWSSTNLVGMVSTILLGSPSCSDPVQLTSMLLDRFNGCRLIGVTHFIPQGIDEVPSPDWNSFAQRLSHQLFLLEQTSILAPGGKLTLPQVYEALLRKDEQVRQEAGPFAPIDPLFLVTVLRRVGSLNRFESTMIQLIQSLCTCTSEAVFHACLCELLSDELMIEMTLRCIACNIEYVQSGKRIMRLIMESTLRLPSNWVNPLFTFSAIVPDSTRPFYANNLASMIAARLPLPPTTLSVLQWIFPDELAETQLLEKFFRSYGPSTKDSVLDFGLSFNSNVDCSIKTLRQAIVASVEGHLPARLFFRQLQP